MTDDDDIDFNLPELRSRERPFEYALRDELKSEGILFVKLKPTIEGFPDRLAIGFKRTRLVEIKRHGEPLSEVQKIRHRELWRDYGIEVLVVQGPDVKAAASKVSLALRRGR